MRFYSTEYLKKLLFNFIAASIFMPNRLRTFFYNLGGMNIKTYDISPRTFMGGSNISIGSNTFINWNCFFDNTDSIEIGKNCLIGMEVMFCTSEHKYKNFNGLLHLEPSSGRKIMVKDNCWIGARATILPGVVIGESCVIAAGALVNKDCEPFSVYAGVPAKKVRDI